ncbi:hypothetical protein [Comamonas thiooxydans]|uniref:hypothetical protein n=1 Tax=Comamonas thiooxydans TaxID=363952 RepID=UPI0007C4375B|nr:hypothetical protein [Comamonas thiooxydans]
MGDPLVMAIDDSARRLQAAERTLLGRGYTYHGGELWKPPLGKAPDFDRNDRNAALLAEIDAHMRDMWDKRLLPASCWPTDLSRRVSEAAGGPSTLDEIMRKNGL